MTSESELPAKVSRAVQEAVLAVRAILQAVPTVGSALEVQIFQRLQEREHQRLVEFVRQFSERVKQLESNSASMIRLEHLETDEFRHFLREVLMHGAREHQREKIRAFQEALLDTMMHDPRIHFDRRKYFLEALASLSVDHLRLLDLLFCRRDAMRVSDIWTEMKAEDEATRNYVYAGLDTMANRQFLTVGPIPMRAVNPPALQEMTSVRYIVKEDQTYKIGSLGVEFLVFIGSAKSDETRGRT